MSEVLDEIDSSWYEEHPLLPLPTKGQAREVIRQLGEVEGRKRLFDGLKMRRQAIDAERADPYNAIYKPFYWHDAKGALAECDEILALGGNRSGKSKWASYEVMDVLAKNGGKVAWCLHTTSSSSVEMQHPLMYEMIPRNWKVVPQRTKRCNINFSIQNGFSGDKFVLPNASQCIFKNYSQDIKVIEGGEPDIIWCDELVPLNWVETLRYRLMTRRGKLIITFTPIYGYNTVVKDYVGGGRHIKSLPMDYVQPELGRSRKITPLLPMDQPQVTGLPKGHMPYIMEGRKPHQRVIFFWGQWNPYSPFSELQKKCRAESSIEIKKRAFGWAENLVGSQFPRFSDEVNVVKHDKIPSRGTNYMVVDPAGARNWFMLWARVVPGPDGRDIIYIYREWPDMSLGEWALPSEKHDGRMGPAQTSGAGLGTEGYKRMILELEDGESIFERFIDPRGGHQAVVAEEQGTSIIDMLAAEHKGADGKIVPGMHFLPSAAKTRDETIAMVNDWLSYNQEGEVNALNQPRLYVSERCRNLIYCMKEWTGLDGEKGASKDPIDCLRYLAVEDIASVDESRAICTQPRSY